MLDMHISMSLANSISTAKAKTLVRKPFPALILVCAHDIQERREIVNWLSPLNFKAVQGEILRIGQERTGQWALESEEFQTWRNGSKEMLWCCGIREPYFYIGIALVSDPCLPGFWIAGSGKTVLS
jgi:hypothetical protein